MTNLLVANKNQQCTYYTGSSKVQLFYLCTVLLKS